MPIQALLIARIVAVATLVQMTIACDSKTFSDQRDIVAPSEITPKDVASERQKRFWEVSQLTDKKLFSVKLSCQKKPFVGDFQICHILLKRDAVKISGAVISIDGGMKTHGHGLPTSPKLIPTDLPGQYSIEGLKFSMPGDWVIGFRITANELSDQSIFKLSI